MDQPLHRLVIVPAAHTCLSFTGRGIQNEHPRGPAGHAQRNGVCSPAMKLRPAVLLAVITSLAMTATSDASRPATDGEFAALSASNSVAGVGLEGVQMTVSTVDSTWASLVATKRDLSELRDQTAVVNWNGYEWEIVTLVDPREPLRFCGGMQVPVGAGVDLAVCKAPPTLPVVLSIGGFYTRPKKMGQGAHGYYKRLRWSRWTAASASGRGIFDYGDRYSRILAPVKITLSGPRRCESGVVVFTRQRISAVRRSDRARIRFATSVRSLPGCPAMDEEDGSDGMIIR